MLGMTIERELGEAEMLHNCIDLPMTLHQPLFSRRVGGSGGFFLSRKSSPQRLPSAARKCAEAPFSSIRVVVSVK